MLNKLGFYLVYMLVYIYVDVKLDTLRQCCRRSIPKLYRQVVLKTSFSLIFIGRQISLKKTDQTCTGIISKSL